MDKSLNSQFPTPILFLTFNRPQLTLRVFQQIRIMRPSRLYVSSDGPRDENPLDIELIQQCREIFEKIDWPCSLFKIYHVNNQGCKTAVEHALDLFFQNETMGIILEDDCLPSSSFFWFCQTMLERYYDSNISMVSGFTPHCLSNAQYSYRFSTLMNIWGWATWRRSWIGYSKCTLTLEEVNRNNVLFLRYGRFGKKVFKVFHDFSRTDSNSSWCIPWIYHCMNNLGYAIMPSVSLIQNIGFIQSATHTTSDHEFSLITPFQINFPIIHPGTPPHPDIIRNDIKYLKSYYRKDLKYIIRRILNIL